MPLSTFLEFVSRAILSLPQDMKACLRLAEDPEVEDESRIMLAGVLLHVLSGANAIPGLRGILAYLDDALVIRLAIERLAANNPQALERHRDAAPELFEPLPEDMSLARDCLGNIVQLLDKALDEAPRLTHQGRSAEQCIRDADHATWLYDAVHSAIVERLEFDEDETNREVKRVDALLEPLRNQLNPGR